MSRKRNVPVSAYHAMPLQRLLGILGAGELNIAKAAKPIRLKIPHKLHIGNLQSLEQCGNVIFADTEGQVSHKPAHRTAATEGGKEAGVCRGRRVFCEFWFRGRSQPCAEDTKNGAPRGGDKTGDTSAVGDNAHAHFLPRHDCTRPLFAGRSAIDNASCRFASSFAPLMKRICEGWHPAEQPSGKSCHLFPHPSAQRTAPRCPTLGRTAGPFPWVQGGRQGRWDGEGRKVFADVPVDRTECETKRPRGRRHCVAGERQSWEQGVGDRTVSAGSGVSECDAASCPL